MFSDNKKEFYLDEDKEILTELESLNPHTTQELNDMQRYKINSLHIKSVLRNKKSMVDMDKSTSRYSLILSIFAMVQIVIALSQFLFEAETSQHKWLALGLACFMTFSIWFIFKAFDPNKILKK